MTNSETVLGKYRIKEELRKRREGVVYLGVDIEINQAVIFTVLDAELIHPQQFLARFELIAETLKGIDSPYGAALLDYGEQEGQAIIVQEYVEGQSLSEMLTDSDGLPENLVLDIAQQVGEYLRDLHQADLLHGSLSPDTILLSSKGTVQVRDAGLAQGMNLNQLSADGKIEASPFHAPESRSGGELTPATDFYALGATLFELLTGEKLELEPADLWPGNKRQGLSPELDELVFKCLQVDPARRMQSAAELLNGIQETRRGSQAGAQDTILGMEDVLVGHTLGAYQLTERLGQGGMATVYKAYEPALDRYVAIKVLPQFFARDPNFMNRFRREAKAVAQLNHPSIMPIYSYGEEGDITYIAMQYVPGGTLKQGRGQVYEPAEGIRLALPIVRALAYAHQRGIVHRDIKPSNVLLGENDWPVLADFGLAKMAEASQQLTGTGVGVGTPMYMSPEQGQGTNVDHRTDIYSMGIMLYEMLTGDVPFRADTPMAVVIKHMTAPLPMPREANPDIPEALERIILKATAKSADDRYQTAEEMITALERVQNSLLAPAKDTEPAEDAAPAPRESESPPAPLARKFKKIGVILGGIIGVLLIGLILMWFFDVCPPPGLWPIPPWCPGTTYQLPTIGGDEEPTTAIITEGTLGSILFQDDFDEEPADRWVFQPTAWTVEKVSGRTVLRNALPTGDYSGAEIRGTNWENYAIEFDFRFLEPDQFGANYFYLRGRITNCPPTIQSLQVYSVVVAPDKVFLDKAGCVDGGSQKLTESDKDISADDWHTLQYLFIGNRVQLFIDGEQFIDYIDANDPFSGGDLWIETSGSVEVIFDNLKVYEVIPGEGSAGETIAAANLCAAGETLLLYENFESGYQNEWVFQNVSGVETSPWEIVEDSDGNHVIQGDGHTWAQYAGVNQSDIEFRLRMRKGMPPDSTHLNFGLSEAGRYIVAIGDEMILDKEPDDLAVARATYGSQTEWHDIKISSVGGHITVYVDDQLRLDYQDPDPLPAGPIGIENTYGNIWYDDIIVCTASINEESQESEFVPTGIFVDSGQNLGRGGGSAVALADLDGDGDLDAVLGEQLWINSGGAQGGTPGHFVPGSRSLDPADSISLGDIDADGDLDILTANSAGGTNSIWTNMSGLQSGQAGDFGDFENTLGREEDSWTLDTGDLDGDGDLDAFVGNWDENDVWLNDGTGNFSAQGARLGKEDTRAVAINDLDGDGDLDVFDVGNQYCKVWLNDGLGNLQDAGSPDCVSNNVSLAMGDLDGDGDMDAFIGNGSGQPDVVWLNDGGAQGGTPGTFTDSGQRLGNAGSEAVALVDLDSDGDLDAIIANDPGANQIWLNDGSGFFTQIDFSFGVSESRGLALGDVDGDGDVDILVGNGGENKLWLNQNDSEMRGGDTLFLDSGQRLGERSTRSIAAGDVDGDEDIDIIAGNTGQTNLVWTNTGDGLFIQGFETGQVDDTYSVSPGDYDGDGDLDLFLTNWSADSYVLPNGGQGEYETSQPLILPAGVSEAFGSASGDLDGDGDLDIWMAAGGSNYVWINDGNGEFSNTGILYPGGDSVGVTLGDLDSDGDLDAFVANYVGGANFVYMNQGNGSFTDSGQRLGDFPSNDVALGDLDGDGDLDAYVANLEDQPNTVWLNNGEGAFVDSGQRLDQLTSNAVALGDLDNDGDLDAYVVNGKIDAGEPKSNTIYLNDGLGNFTTIEHQANLTISTDVVLLDLNGDGWLDIVEATTETILIWFNQEIFGGAAEETSESAEISDASSPCDFTLDDVGQSAIVAGTIGFVDDATPGFWYADLTADGCMLGITVNRMMNEVWFDQTPEAFELGASAIVEGTFVSFPYPDNPDQMQLILELTSSPQIWSETLEASPNLASLDDPWGVVTIPPGDSILLGVAADLSGLAQELGQDQHDAVQLVISDFGLVAGFPVELMTPLQQLHFKKRDS